MGMVSGGCNQSFGSQFISQYLAPVHRCRDRLFVPPQHGFGTAWCVPRIIAIGDKMLLDLTGNLDAGLE